MHAVVCCCACLLCCLEQVGEAWGLQEQLLDALAPPGIGPYYRWGGWVVLPEAMMSCDAMHVGR
jgi:hypothetical protein